MRGFAAHSAVGRGAVKTLVLGGVRSGKSRYAGELARAEACPVTLIVTGAAGDAEMAARIEAHRASRPSDWTVVEESTRLSAALRAAASPARVVIVDCLTLWLSNLLWGEKEGGLPKDPLALREPRPGLGARVTLTGKKAGPG